MPELTAPLQHRWFRVRSTGQTQTTYAWAEKFLDDPTEALDSCEKRLAEPPSVRLHPPLASHENADVRAVCVDPV